MAEQLLSSNSQQWAEYAKKGQFVHLQEERQEDSHRRKPKALVSYGSKIFPASIESILFRFSGKGATFLSVEEVVDHARTELRRGRAASPFNGAGKRSRRLVAKVEGHFLNCSCWAGFKEAFDSVDQHLFPNVAERFSRRDADSFLNRSSANAQFTRKVRKRA
jgi:hypothetical protein